MSEAGIFHFLSHFNSGFARQNRFRVRFNLPRGVRLSAGSIGVNKEATQGQITKMEKYLNSGGSINIKCHTCQFPDRTVSTQEITQNSAPYKGPYSASYNPVSFSFYANSQFDTRDYFDIWQSAVLNVGTNTMNFYDEYVSDVQLIAMDQYGNDAYTVTLLEAWPLQVGSVDMSYSALNQVVNTTVTLAYKNWKSQYDNSAGGGSAPT